MRWSGVLGFVMPAVETATSVFTEPVEEVPYRGTIVRESRGAAPNTPNPTPYVRMAISVLPGKQLRSKIAALRYATYMDQKWSISSVEFQGQMCILNLGDKYE